VNELGRFTVFRGVKSTDKHLRVIVFSKIDAEVGKSCEPEILDIFFRTQVVDKWASREEN